VRIIPHPEGHCAFGFFVFGADMEKSKVVLCRCEEYSRAEEAVLRMLGELDAELPERDKKILIKPISIFYLLI
jgi:hypothetical protein